MKRATAESSTSQTTREPYQHKVVKQDGERVNRIQSIVLDQIDLPNPVDMDIEKLARENAELRQALETFIIHYQNSEAIRREKEK